MGHAGDDAEVVGDQQDGQAKLALEFHQQAQDLRLDGDVQRRGGFVGDQQIGVAHQCHRDHDALAQAAGELVRILGEAHFGRGDTNAAEQLGGPGEGLAAGGAAMAAQDFGHLRADRVGRVQAGHRLLEDHCYFVAAQAGHRGLIEAADVLPGEIELVGGTNAAPREQAHDGEGGNGFAAAAFADEAMGFATADFDIDAPHGLGFVVEADPQAADGEQGVAHASRVAPSMSRSPSPRKLMPSTRVNSAMPGTMITHGLKNM